MSAPFDPRALGLGIGQSASVIDANEPLHSSRGFGWHHDAWRVTRVGPDDYRFSKHHVTREADWDAWGPWDACQTGFNPR